MLPAPSIILLRDLLSTFVTTGERPKENAFLRAHPDAIKEIRRLVGDGYIFQLKDRYSVSVLGLAMLPPDDTAALLGSVEQLRTVAREEYTKADKPRLSLRSNLLKERSGLGDPQFKVALYYAYRPFGYLDGGSEDSETGELLDNIGVDIKVLEKPSPLEVLADIRRHHEAEAPHPILPGGAAGERRFENYEKLGEGAYGDVWRARDTSLRRVVAVKFIRSSGPADLGALEHARALARVQHQNIVTVHDVENVDDPVNGGLVPAVVMELVEGEDLTEKLGHVLDAVQARRIGTAILDAISAYHAHGLAHADLHEANVMVGDAHVKVLDPLYFDTALMASTASRQAQQAKDVRGVRDLLVQILHAGPVDLDVASEFVREAAQPTLEKLRAAFVAALAKAEPASMVASLTTSRDLPETAVPERLLDAYARWGSVARTKFREMEALALAARAVSQRSGTVGGQDALQARQMLFQIPRHFDELRAASTEVELLEGNRSILGRVKEIIRPLPPIPGGVMPRNHPQILALHIEIMNRRQAMEGLLVNVAARRRSDSGLAESPVRDPEDQVQDAPPANYDALIELLRRKEGPPGGATEYNLVHLALDLGWKHSDVFQALQDLAQSGAFTLWNLNEDEINYSFDGSGVPIDGAADAVSRSVPLSKPGPDTRESPEPATPMAPDAVARVRTYIMSSLYDTYLKSPQATLTWSPPADEGQPELTAMMREAEYLSHKGLIDARIGPDSVSARITPAGRDAIERGEFSG